MSRATLGAVLGALLVLTAGCATTAPAVGDLPTVGSPGHPVFIVAYTPNDAVRIGFEDQLEADLAAAGITSVPSHEMVGNFALIRRDWVLGTAAERDAPLILMVRRLVTELPGDGTAPPPEVRPHRSLREYFLNVDRMRLPDVPPAGRQVIEVAGYLRDGSAAELVWRGYSWVEFDGDLEAAIARTSSLIADNLAPACSGMLCAP